MAGCRATTSVVALALCRTASMKTHVYVDGFNLYYCAVKDTAYKWLNIDVLCRTLLPENEIVKIKYFTARVKPRPGDPSQHTRQDIYLRALRTVPHLEIHFEKFLSHTVTMPLADPPARGTRFAQVIKTEEKGSDVNIATHMLADGFRGEYKVAILITNDSDLLEPIRLIRNELNLTVGILNPERNRKRWSKQLQQHADFMKPIRQGALVASQFSDPLIDSRGRFTKPSAW